LGAVAPDNRDRLTAGVGFCFAKLGCFVAGEDYCRKPDTDGRPQGQLRLYGDEASGGTPKKALLIKSNMLQLDG